MQAWLIEIAVWGGGAFVATTTLASLLVTWLKLRLRSQKVDAN